jgi:hypothetical protein
MLAKPESVQSIVRLIDACSQCTQMFHSDSVTRGEPCNELTEKIQQKLDQFVAELRNEVRHLDRKTFMSFIEDFDSYSFEPISSESETEALRQMLDWYDKALTAPLSTEARAMIVRQRLGLQQSYEQLLVVSHAA